MGREIEYATDAFRSGRTAGDGPYTKKCSELLSEIIGTKRTLLTTSCTHALEMCALLLDLKAGDEIVAPAFTFVSTLNAFVLRGATPVFSDIRPDTLNIDETRLELLLGPKTKAIVVVHYGGVACQMDVVGEVARRRGIPVIEDNAHGLMGSFRGRPLGSFGLLATQSFHETKNLSCGEGGALAINDPELIERAEIIREKGTDRSKLFRGLVDKYTWVDLGSSYLPSDALAAFLLGQLEARREIQAKRHHIWSYYEANLRDWASRNSVTTPHVPRDREHPAHLYYLLLPNGAARDRLITFLRERGIQSSFHYLPLHLSAMGRKYGGHDNLCPVTESTSSRLLRLPLHCALTEQDLERVVDSVCSFNC